MVLPASDPAEAGAYHQAQLERELQGGLLAAWTALAEEAEEPNVFLAPFMMLPALRAFAAGRRVDLLFFYAPHPTHRSQPDLLVGMCALEQRRSRLLPLPAPSGFRHPAIHLGTPLCRPGYARAVAEGLLDHLGERRQVVTLPEIRADGPFHDAIIDALNARGWGHLGHQRSSRALLRPHPDGAEAYLRAALEGKRRKELRRQRDRLGEAVAAHGPLEVRELGPGEDPEPWLHQFLELEASGWKGREGVALAARPETRRFFLEAMTAAHRQGRLHLQALRDGPDTWPLAMKVNLIAGAGAFAFKIAFDERYARYSPGVQLELENVHWLHRQPQLRWMDSCAHHTRFMINHLWIDRRPVEWLVFSTGHAGTDLLVALLPALAWARRQVQARLQAQIQKEPS